MAVPDFYLSATAAITWLIVLLLPWRPWSVKEVLEADLVDDGGTDLSNITMVIPARNEAEVIAAALSALERQGQGLNVVVVDDDSSDGTADIIHQSNSLFESKSLPNGWAGKLWAQEQGLKEVQTAFTLLLDADIALQPGMMRSLKAKLASEHLHFVSLMAVLRFTSFWEKLLMPAFVFFFKMIYPFALANKPGTKLAAAGG
jgi:glycosyltransferase involved in cell wall biosynthesis